VHEAKLAHRKYKQFLRHLIARLRGGQLKPGRAGFSVAVGLYIGVQLVFGLHLPLCLLVCVPLRLDALVAYAAANISNPFLAAFIVFAEVQLGSLALDGKFLPFTMDQAKGTHLAHLALQTAVGAQLLGVGLAILGGVVAARVAQFARSRQARTPSAKVTSNLSRAVQRTVARYAKARAADRHYVACKLHWDPITRLLGELPIDWGSVLDIGCGRGQLGLLLIELERIRVMAGIDWDAHKIEIAQQAAGTDATFELGDLTTVQLAPCQTALLIDVLHYLAAGAQIQLLKQISDQLVPGGALVVRDVDARHTWRSRLTRFFEVLGTRLQINRGRQLCFRSSGQLRSLLQQLGFTIVDVIAMPGLTLDNVLIIARKGYLPGLAAAHLEQPAPTPSRAAN